MAETPFIAAQAKKSQILQLPQEGEAFFLLQSDKHYLEGGSWKTKG